MAFSAMIELQGEFTYLGKVKKSEKWQELLPDQICRLVSEKGIINTFDRPSSLAAVINSFEGKKPPLLAVRMYDDDPANYTDRFIAGIWPEKIYEGAAILARALNVRGVVFVVDHASWKSPVTGVLEQLFGSIPWAFVPAVLSRYPCGGRREVSDIIARQGVDKFFAEISRNDVMIDSTTALSLYEGLVYSIPVLDRFVHVSGTCLQSEKLFRVRIGTPIRSLVEECGGFKRIPDKMVINGVIRGTSVSDLAVPVTKYVKSVRFIAPREMPDQKQSVCIRCGKCYQVCPNKLRPSRLYALLSPGAGIEPGLLQTLDLCAGCMLCNTVCPARLPLYQAIELLKKMKGTSHEL
jgi:electron transport complex protein RnfC